MKNRIKLFRISFFANFDEAVRDIANGYNYIIKNVKSELIRPGKSAGFKMLETRMLSKSPFDAKRLDDGFISMFYAAASAIYSVLREKMMGEKCCIF